MSIFQFLFFKHPKRKASFVTKDARWLLLRGRNDDLVKVPVAVDGAQDEEAILGRGGTPSGQEAGPLARLGSGRQQGDAAT